MKDFMDLARKRRSCRAYDGKPVTKEDLSRCVEAAMLAPSACNSQPWKFVVITNDAKRRELAKHVQEELGMNKWTDDVPAFIVVAEEPSPRLMPKVDGRYGARRFSEGDVGMATAFLLLEAADIGVDTCVIGTFDFAAAREIAALPEGYTVRAIIAAGRGAEDAARPKQRKSFDEAAVFIE